MAAAVAATVRDPGTPALTRHPGTDPAPPALTRPPPASYPPSSRRYRDLHTFELQAPTRLIEWARGDRECELGSAEGSRGTGLQPGGLRSLWPAGGEKEA